MPKQNQINALVTANKGNAEHAVTEIYKIVQKESLFRGFERTYKPLDDNDIDRPPAERQRVQYRAADLLAAAQAKWTDVWDLILTQDTGNQQAKADLVVDGKVIVKDVPVTTLLYLDKQVNDVETFISKLPTPDMAEEWAYDNNSGLLKTKETSSLRTRKIEDFKVAVPPTKEHPAQVIKVTEDRPVGTWTKISYSGEISTDKKNQLKERVKQLKNAIKVAREQANMIDVEKKKVGDAVFAFLLQN